MAIRRLAADYAETADRERMYARVQALQLAHDRDVPAKDVVARAEEYIAFIADEPNWDEAA